MKRFLFLVLSLVLAVSCSKGQQGDYVAKIDNTAITKEDVQFEMNALPEMAKEFFQGQEGTTRFVDELVKKELLYAEAKKRGLENNKDFQKRVEEFKKITLINQLLEKEIETASKVSDKEIRDYYDAHKADFTENSRIRISQILLKTEADAKKAYERLEKGEDFAKVASAMSIDKAGARSGGDLGYFKKGDLNGDLEAVAFRLKKGEISQPLKLKDGIHILRLTDAQGSAVEFEKLRNQLGQRLTAEKQKETFDKFIETLKKGHKIDVNKDAIAKMNLTPAPAPAAPQHK